MNEQGLQIRAGLEECSSARPKVLKFIALVLQMAAGLWGLVLIFGVLAVVTVWNGCASELRSWSNRMTPVDRNVFTRMRSWRRTIHLFYLGSAASWPSSQASLLFSPRRPFVPTEVRASSSPVSQTEFLEARKSLAVRFVLEPLLVPRGLHPVSIKENNS